MTIFTNSNNIHFIGIGGSGISALAYWFLAQGKAVSGSDASENATTKDLIRQGVHFFKGHETENVGEETDLVIYTEAIDKQSNPEYLKAQKRGIKCLSYFEALGQLSATKKTIAVAGTHGKTTTTAMLGQALAGAGLDPTVIVGSRVPAFENRNIRIGKSDWLVAESCEYRRSFLHLQPFGMILLNCELEHVDYYKDLEDYMAAFQELVAKLPEDGFLIYNQQDVHCQKIAQDCKVKTIGVTLENAKKITLQIPGEFNQLNAAHALSAGLQIGAEKDRMLDSLKSFSGTARRMEIKGEKDGVLMMDDYGHHPTEVKATLKAIKQAYSDKRLICIFQPHQYSRTIELLDGFKHAFVDADLLVVPNIYEARDSEEDKINMNVEKLLSTIDHPQKRDGEGLEKTTEWLKENAKPGDLVVSMGAGDVYKVGEAFLSTQ